VPVTNNVIYGSKMYENVVLRHTPTATFGSYASATNSINDMTNRNYLSASFVTGASFSPQIPFFTLPSEYYTFDINLSNKIVIKENTSSYTNALGSGAFCSGDEGREFAVEFLLAKNYDTQSNSDFARFGIDNGQHTVGISYSNRANEFYLNVYSQNGYIRHRSVVFAGPSKVSKHFVINFYNGRPVMYINGIKSKALFDYLGGSTFFARKITGRTVAEFSCSTSTERILISMISFYNYALSEEVVNNHFSTLFDIGDFKEYISAFGSPLLYERIPYAQKISRNEGQNQSFFGSNYSNIITNPYITTVTYPNFTPFGIDPSYLNKVNYAGGTGVASIGGFSFKSDDMNNYLDTDSLQIYFTGVSTGRYTKENTLASFAGTSQGDIYVAVDSASSKIHIGIGTSSVLVAMSSSVSQSASISLNISKNDSVINVGYSDGSEIIYYNFASDLDFDRSTTYLFNRYVEDPSSGTSSAVGSPEINFNHTYAATNNGRVYLTDTALNSSGSVVWVPQQSIDGIATVSIPTPSSSQNYFYSDHSSDSINYALYIDGVFSSISNESIVSIPTTGSNIYLYASLTNYWNGGMYDISKNLAINSIMFYNFSSGSYAGGGYPAILETSVGLINDQDNYLNIFKQKNIGFLQMTGNICKVYNTNTFFPSIEQIDFLLAIPDTLSSSAQCLIDSTMGASMRITPVSGSYRINFSGMTASINSVQITSGSAYMLTRQHYFVQSSLTTPAASADIIYVFSASNGSSPYAHSFDRLSVFPTGITNAKDRYAQIFGRKTVTVRDDHQNYLRVESLPDDYLLLNKSWQVYSS
jgi:hypothetical protein